MDKLLINITTKKALLIGLAIFFVALVGSAVLIHRTYTGNLKPVSSNSRGIAYTVAPGDTTSEIADGLKSKDLIRSDWAFEWYVRNHQLYDQIKAGTYLLNQSQSVEEITQILVDGRVATDLVTILPARRLGQIRQDLINAGFKAGEVDKALKAEKYSSHPALTDKPRGASLEGYLYPESFQKTAETTPGQIIELSLDEMQSYLTPELRQAFSEQGLTLHQAITLASIIEKEVSDKYDPADRPQVAQVFLKRYRSQTLLQSDPTAFYGAVRDGKKPSLGHDSPYNTYLHVGLPPGPISNVSKSSLRAVAFPAQTDWLYFVAGDDGTTYFSKSLEKHEELTRQHCKKLCGGSQ
jgi:UPF0755 protein